MARVNWIRHASSLGALLGSDVKAIGPEKMAHAKAVTAEAFTDCLKQWK
jgi:hypothetical protein